MMDMKVPLITAHAGSDGYPANSLEFIQAAYESKVDAFEIDVQIAEDGTLYLAHDPLHDYSQAVTLEEVFELMASWGMFPGIDVNIDCKDVRVGPIALEMSKRMRVFPSIQLSGALDILDFEEHERDFLMYNVENSLDVYNLDLEELEHSIYDWQELGVVLIQLNYRLLTPEVIAVIKETGVLLSVWTVDDPAVIAQYEDSFVYNVTSNIAMAYTAHQAKRRVQTW